MSKQAPVSMQTGTGNKAPRWARNVFWGGVIGLAVGLATVFVLAVVYGEAIGLAPGACALFACDMTLLLSQPAGLGGVVAGAVAGAVVGGLAHVLHRT